MQRILVRHLKLIFILTQLGLVVGFVISREPAPSYLASTRLLFPSAQLTGEVSTSLADMAEGIATSRSQVEAALEDVGTRRGPDDVADRVTVDAIGESGVMELTVADRDPQVAAALANGLSERVAQVQFAAMSEGIRGLLADVRDRSAEINQMIASAQEQQADTSELPPDIAQLLQRESDLRGERSDLLSQRAAIPKPTILSRANSTAVETVPSGGVQDIALGGLVGLVLGITVAAALETFYPGVVGSQGLRRAFDAPVLGTFPAQLDQSGRSEVKALTRLLGAAAASAEVMHVRLIGAGRLPMDLERIGTEVRACLLLSHKTNGGGAWTSAGRSSVRVGSAETAAPEGRAAVSTRDAGGLATNPRKGHPLSPRLSIEVFDPKGPLPHDDEGGLVVAAAATLDRKEIDQVRDLAAITGWPVLGLIRVGG